MSSLLKAPRPLLSNHFRCMHANRMFDMVSIEGRQGIGKTQYLMWLLYGIYGDWDKVLPHLFMELGAAFRYMRQYKNMTKKIPAVGFDDAGVYAGRYKCFEKGGFNFISQLNSVVDLAREATHGIILTSPDEDVAGFLRNKSWLLTQIRWMRSFQGVSLEKDYRVATTYRRKKRPDGRVFPKKICIDIFKINSIPGDLVKEYYEIRNRVTDPFFDRAIVEIDKMSQLPDLNPTAWIAKKVLYDRDVRTPPLTFPEIAKEFAALGVMKTTEGFRQIYLKAKDTQATIQG